jgi:hypothetical protein
VVIGILAVITVVAFNGVDRRAAAAAAKSSQAQFAKKVETFKVEGGAYPTSITDCPTPAPTNICIPPIAGTTLLYYAFGKGIPLHYYGAQHSDTPAYELAVLMPKDFYYTSTAEITSSNEFVQYMDMAPIIDKYGLRPYKISFDIKSASTAMASSVNMYMQNGSGARYVFGANVPVTTSFERRTVTVTPVVADLSLAESILAFYGTYGTGNRPTIRNVEITAG